MSFEQVWANHVDAVIDGVVVHFISKKDLIGNKRQVGRLIDLAMWRNSLSPARRYRPPSAAGTSLASGRSVRRVARLTIRATFLLSSSKMPEAPPAKLPYVSVAGATTALVLLTALNFVNYIDRYILPGVQEMVKHEFRATDERIGALTFWFMVAYVLAAPVTGWLGDRFARKPLIVGAALFASAINILTGTVHSFDTLMVRHAALGLGEACFGIFGPAILADFYPDAQRNRVLTIFNVALPFGAALGYLIGGSVGGRYGWRMPFYVSAAPGIVVALLILFIMKEPERGASEGLRAKMDTGTVLALARNPGYLMAVLGLAAVTFFAGRHLVVDAVFSAARGGTNAGSGGAAHRGNHGHHGRGGDSRGRYMGAAVAADEPSRTLSGADVERAAGGAAGAGVFLWAAGDDCADAVGGDVLHLSGQRAVECGNGELGRAGGAGDGACRAVVPDSCAGGCAVAADHRVGERSEQPACRPRDHAHHVRASGGVFVCWQPVCTAAGSGFGMMLRVVEVTAWVVAFSWVSKVIEAAIGMPKVANLLDGGWDRQPEGLPTVTVIVPARNEERDVEACLGSLLAQDYGPVRIVAVDDRSTDRTGALMDGFAAAHPGRLRVQHIAALPENWLGKTHAMAMAAAQANTDWLLFTDADVMFQPDSVRRSLAYAVASGADHLVTVPTPVIDRWDEGTVLGFFQIFGLWGGRPWKVANPKARHDAIGVGAFNLVRRSAYEQIGGYTALRMEIVEDIGLGRRIKRAGLAQRIAFGQGLVTVHWAAGALGLVDVMTKNIFSAFRFYVSLALAVCVWLVVFCAAPVLGLLLRETRLPAVLTLLSVGWAYRLYGRVSGISAWQAVLSPVAALVFVYTLLRSMVVTLRQGGVVWRGTFYPLERLREHAAPLL